MNELRIFENSEFGSVRTLLLNGEPWFVGKDVAGALGYAKPLNALATHIDEDDSLKRGLIDSMGRTQETILINESGLYSLILGSQLQNAKKFKRWVTSDVLPSIRKTGSYSVNPKKTRSVTGLACSLIACMEANGDSPDITAKALGDIATHFNVPLSELFHAEPEPLNASLSVKKRHSLSVDEQQRYPALLEELKEIATVCNDYSYILPKDFNSFCEENSISMMVFRRWLYQNDFICGHYDKKKLQYTFSKWQDNHSIRIIKFK